MRKVSKFKNVVLDPRNADGLPTFNNLNKVYGFSPDNKWIEVDCRADNTFKKMIEWFPLNDTTPDETIEQRVILLKEIEGKDT